MKKYLNSLVFKSAIAVSLIGILAIGCDEFSVTEGIRPLNFKATVSNTLVTAGNSITYRDSSLNVSSRIWTFESGDIDTSDQEIIPVTYDVPSEVDANGINQGYITNLAVTFNDGSVQNNSFKIFVLPQIELDYSASATTALVGSSIQFTNLSENLESEFIEVQELDTFEWTFQGGTPATSTADNPTVTYNTPGVFAVTQTAHREGPVDDAVLTRTGFITIVADLPLVPAFTADIVEIEPGQSVTFTNQSTGGGDAINWTFPGGVPETSTDSNPVVLYDTSGTFDVILEVTRSVDGAVETLTEPAFITVGSPRGPICTDPTNLVACGNNDGEEDVLFEWNIVGDDMVADRSANFSVSTLQAAPGGGTGSLLYEYSEPGAPAFTDAFLNYNGILIDVQEAGNYTITLDHFGDVVGGTEYVFNLGFANNANGADIGRSFVGRVPGGQWVTTSRSADLAPGQYFVRVDIFNPGFNASQSINLFLDNITVVRN